MDGAVIGYLRGENVRAEFCESLLAICTEGRTRIAGVHALPWGPNLSGGRNRICDTFLRDRRAPWLFMCDTDMVLPADTVDRLIGAADPDERPVVGGYCHTVIGARAVPTMYDFATDENGRILPVTCESWPEDQLVQVGGTGAACLLIHRNALIAVAASSRDRSAPWFRESDSGYPLTLLGEDLTFCLRCAAAQVPVYVHTGIRAGHVKTQILA